MVHFILVSASESLQSIRETRTRKRQKLSAVLSLIPACHAAELSPASYCWWQRPGLDARGSPLLARSPPLHAAEEWAQPTHPSLAVPCTPCGGVHVHLPQLQTPGLQTQLPSSSPLRCCSVIGSVGWDCRNALFPFQRRLKRCGGAAGTASSSGRFPCIFSPRVRGSGGSSAVEMCVYLCTAG